jgi:Fe/S biogenesis protein NfuA
MQGMDTLRITMTPAAQAKVAAAAASAGHPEARLRIRVTGRRSGRYVYDLTLVNPAHPRLGDIVVDAGAGIVHVDSEGAEHVDGITIDLDPSVFGGAITVTNPHDGWTDPVERRIQELLDRHINPAIASHGGIVDLLGVDGGTAYLQFGGGCQGCAQVDVTLRQGVEVALREAVPEIVAVVDSTDHAAGTNPYYQPSKK